jgi:hypothetical protein
MRYRTRAHTENALSLAGLLVREFIERFRSALDIIATLETHGKLRNDFPKVRPSCLLHQFQSTRASVQYLVSFSLLFVRCTFRCMSLFENAAVAAEALEAQAADT